MRKPCLSDKLPVDVKCRSAEKISLRQISIIAHVFEQTGECVFIMSLDFKFITANQQALQLLGYEKYQLSTLPVEEIIQFDEPFSRGDLLEKNLNFVGIHAKEKERFHASC